jgi:hypothetical protein
LRSVSQEYKVHSGEESPKLPFKALLNVLLKTSIKGGMIDR